MIEAAREMAAGTLRDLSDAEADEGPPQQTNADQERNEPDGPEQPRVGTSPCSESEPHDEQMGSPRESVKSERAESVKSEASIESDVTFDPDDDPKDDTEVDPEDHKDYVKEHVPKKFGIEDIRKLDFRGYDSQATHCCHGQHRCGTDERRSVY